jgi:hypothetical protein
MSRTVAEALETAEAAGYRIGALLGQDAAPDAGDEPAPEVEPESPEAQPSLTGEPEPQEPVVAEGEAFATDPPERE